MFNMGFWNDNGCACPPCLPGNGMAPIPAPVPAPAPLPAPLPEPLPEPELGPPPLLQIPPKQKDSETEPDPNIANPRLLVNRACIYERHLPGDAYITAHVQRLQHGYYSSPSVSDKDFDHVDFLAVNFVFHSPNTLEHRFMAATIRASVRGNREIPTSTQAQTQPRFLMHAPHLIFGAVSPETLQWNFGLAGSLGIAEFPVSASLSPSGGVRGRYRRYEMMRIQGSARTLKSARGGQFDVESGEIVWSLEENSLQKSGLPREFTFAMLIQKPRAESRVQFSLDIDPVIQSWYGNYPRWWLSLSRYQPVRRRPVDFKREIGQRFEPVSSKEKKFNFASLESSFDDYVHMPGRRVTSGTGEGGLLGDDNEFRPEVTRDMVGVMSKRPPASNPMAMPIPVPTPMPVPVKNPVPTPLDVRVLLDSGNGEGKRRRYSNPERAMVRRNGSLRRTRSRDALRR